MTPILPHTDSVVVTSGGVAVTFNSITIDDASAPTITSVSPTQAVQGEDIVVSGTNLADETVVLIGGASCDSKGIDCLNLY